MLNITSTVTYLDSSLNVKYLKYIFTNPKNKYKKCNLYKYFNIYYIRYIYIYIIILLKNFNFKNLWEASVVLLCYR